MIYPKNRYFLTDLAVAFGQRCPADDAVCELVQVPEEPESRPSYVVRTGHKDVA